MDEEATKILQNIWQQMLVLDRNLTNRIDQVGAKVDSAVGALMALVDAKLERLKTELQSQLRGSELVVDRLAQQMSDNFVRVQTTLDTRLARVDARLDAIEGRLMTLNATVALHDLKLGEAT